MDPLLPIADPPVCLSRWASIQRRPVLVFVIVTFLVSYGLGMLALFIVGAWGPGINEVAKLYLGRFFVVVGPTCGAMAAVAATSGRSAILPFLHRRLSPPVTWWVMFALPVIGMAIVTVAYVAAGVSLEACARTAVQAWPLLLVHLALQILIVGLGEELGWRGWLIPTLTSRHGLARATLITGTIWYFWHFPILLGGIANAFWFALTIGGLSILFSLLWRWSGGSALVPAFAHGSINAPVFFFTAMLPEADHRLAWSILSGMLAVLGLLALSCTGREWKKPQMDTQPSGN